MYMTVYFLIEKQIANIRLYKKQKKILVLFLFIEINYYKILMQNI